MANISSITPLAANEELWTEGSQPSPLCGLFKCFLQNMALHIEAERQFEACEAGTTAHAAAKLAAELSQEQMTLPLSEVLAAAVTCPADTPLLRLALLANALIGSEDLGDALRARGLLRDATQFFCAPGGPLGRRVEALVKTAVLQLEELADLDVYTPQASDGSVERNPPLSFP